MQQRRRDWQNCSAGAHCGKHDRIRTGEHGYVVWPHHSAAACSLGIIGTAALQPQPLSILTNTPTPATQPVAVSGEAEAALTQRAKDVRAFHASDMLEVVRFVVETQAALAATRAEPEAAAGTAAKWPRARWRTLVQAAELYEQLAGMGAELGRWSTDTEVSVVLCLAGSAPATDGHTALLSAALGTLWAHAAATPPTFRVPYLQADTAREAARLCSFLEAVSEAAGAVSYHRAPLRVRMAEQEVPWEEELLVTVRWAAQAAAIALINHGLAEARGLARRVGRRSRAV